MITIHVSLLKKEYSDLSLCSFDEKLHGPFVRPYETIPLTAV